MAQSQAEQQAQAQIAGEPTRTKERQPQPATGTAADPTAQAQQNDEQGGLERKMETRHLTMISLGGVIGTGLFLSSGYTIHQAGPLGAIIAYAIGSVLVYFIMLSLGELSVAMPYAGSFHLYAKRFIGPGTAFTIAVLYWLNWAVALASEFTAAGLLMQRWFPHSPAWVWSAAFIVVVFLLNILSVRLYGESEFWFASIKVLAIIAFIIIGLLAMFGAIPIAGYDHAPMFENFYSDGWLPNGVLPIFSTLLTVVFAFSGTEVVGVAAGETKDPSKAIPKAVHTTVLRLAIFFIGSIAVMAALIPWRKSGVDTSPFVLVFQSIGMPFAGDIMNFVVLTAVLSASNSGLYASTRMVWSMGNEGMIPRWFAKTNRRGVPMLALCAAMAGGLLALLSSVIAASTVYLVLVALSGLSAVVVWIAIAYCQIVFRRRWLESGHSTSELKYRTPGYPYVSWAAFILCTASFVLVIFDVEQRFALVAELVFIVACYGAYFLQQWVRKRKKATEADDLDTLWVARD